ncbi:MAG: TatD family hydrolase [Microgenomates group bacterium]|nr:TatD family hydrolase [Microgenomates group bacterium]
MVDTHCHLNFKIFKNNLDQIIADAKKAGVDRIIVPGTDIESSKRAVEVAGKYKEVYAAVGIHPHHVYKFVKSYSIGLTPCFSTASPPRFAWGVPQAIVSKQISSPIESLLANKKVVAIGEVGIDRYYYEKTKYLNYKVDEEFIDLQKNILIEQINLAKEYNKSLILHNRQATDDLLHILNQVWDKKLAGRTVFHCCEADDKLLDYAIKHKIYIGIDGDITYKKKKQEFIKKVPLDLLVLETDAPFMMPKINKISVGDGPNVPKNIKLIAEFIAKTLNIQTSQLIKKTTKNAQKLFLIK